MRKLRLLFAKTDRAVYISHLDLMHVLQRVFLRAGYQLKYSEGFNPHPVISIAVPLSVGHASVCELLDFTLLDEQLDMDKLVDNLNAKMPEGITALEVYEPTGKASGIKWLRVSGVYEYDTRDVKEMAEQLLSFYGASEINVLRKTKRGEGVLDIAPHIREMKIEAGEGVVDLEAVISVNEPTINPDLLVKALQQNGEAIAPDFAKFKRLEIYKENMEIFR